MKTAITLIAEAYSKMAVVIIVNFISDMICDFIDYNQNKLCDIILN